MHIEINDLDYLRKQVIMKIKEVYNQKFKADEGEFYSELLTLESGINECFAKFVDEQEGYKK